MSKPKVGDAVWWGDDRSTAYEVEEVSGNVAVIREISYNVSLAHTAPITDLTVDNDGIAAWLDDDDDMDYDDEADDWEDDDDD